MQIRSRYVLWAFSIALVLILSACSCLEEFLTNEGESAPAQATVQPADESGVGEETATMALVLTSPAFEQGVAIPRQYTCQGEDISPALAWTGAPSGTQSFALIMDDPDAPRETWVHWVVFNLPAEQTGLPAAVVPDADLGGGIQGRNSWRANGYGGPCPPSGTHRYFFTLYALDTVLSLDESATKADVLAAMQGHILAEAQLMGTYQQS